MGHFFFVTNLQKSVSELGIFCLHASLKSYNLSKNGYGLGCKD